MMLTYSYDRRARAVPFGPSDVERMRKDVLMLMKNVDRVQAEGDYKKLREGTRRWAQRFHEEIYNELVPNITLAVRLWLTGDTKYNSNFEDQEQKWFKYWDQKVRKETWDLYITLGSFPHNEIAWHEEGKRWSEKVKREARKAWAILGEFLDWLKARNVTPSKTERSIEKVRLEGFNITIIGYESDEDDKSLETFKEALRLYRKRASQVAPGLLRSQVPLVFRFDCRLDLGGEYKGSHIEICASPNSTPNEMVKTLAHEMGHHLFKTMSGAMQTFWGTAIHQDLGDLDLRDLSKVWRSGESVWDLMDRLPSQDPVLALQLQGVFHGHSSQQLKAGWDTLDELEDYLARGGNPLWTVPKHPVTAYGTKNSEEAFCEVIGLLVAYGPRTIDPLVRSWLETILPGAVKTATYKRQ